jgi:hypothetical protein
LVKHFYLNIASVIFLLIFFLSFILLRIPFFISENGCTYAYPPPLGFCVWAFGGGLA